MVHQCMRCILQYPLAGAVLNINTRLDAKKIAYILKHSEAKKGVVCSRRGGAYLGTLPDLRLGNSKADLFTYASSPCSPATGGPVLILTSGVAPPAPLLKKIRWRGFHFVHAYGITEATGPAPARVCNCVWQGQ
ncbi:hypothetical protein RHSIM_Rhsim08G0022200 [Rhododendron simsii]|uniref:Uncharacterized protein n=1 Tax=Rhododendron simsii TaxID=118357 RepID=A0A834LIL7_RHOSS|nr:hypothetical protein RHSIM_Rhsim08G0022200 [Rhododendron simsii]